MPRGEETQEPIQEEQEASREVKAQDEVKEGEAQRDMEVVSEPETVVERERGVQESEAIEAAVIEAVEAVEAAVPAADGGRTTEDREGVDVTATEDVGPGTDDREGAAGAATEIRGSEMEGGSERSSEDEISATPITLPKEDPDGVPGSAGEVSATPITLPKEDPDGIPDSRGEVSATPITLPKEDPDGVPDSTAEVSATPITLPGQAREGEDLRTERAQDDFLETKEPAEGGADREGEMEEQEAPEILEPTDVKFNSPAEVGEVILEETSFKVESPTEDGEVILDETSFKFFSPTPDQEVRESSGGEGLRPEYLPEQETGEILEPDAFKPVPAEEDGGEAKNNPIPLPSPATEEGIGQEEEGGSILIGEEGEEVVLEGVDDLEDVMQDQSAQVEGAEEYWEPPEMYIYTAKDGTITFVDAEGNPINCPPQYYLDKDGGSGTAKAWYPGGNTVKAFDVPPFPGYKADEFYIKEGEINTQTGKPTYILVDRNGNPVSHQPDEIKLDAGGDFSYWQEGGAGYIPVKLFSESEIYIYTAKDGTKTLVDSSGNTIKCPPMIGGDPESGYFFKGSDGEKFQVNEYSPPTTDIYVYTTQDGTKTVVDSNGDPVKCPPPIYNNPEGEGTLIVGPGGQKIEIPDYIPQVIGTLLYTAQDGTKIVVDSNGNPIKCPPPIWNDPSGDGALTIGPGGEKIKFSTYKPPVTGIYAYTAQDGTKTIVDENGNPIKCPPFIMNGPGGEGTLTVGPEGQKIEIPDYSPPITDIYIYTKPDGSRTVVDKYGDPVKSPPYIWNDPTGEGGTVITGPDGKPLKLQEYKPISSHWD